MTKEEILTRAVELIYMSHGVPSVALVDTSYDAARIMEVLDDGSGHQTVAAILEIALMDRFKVSSFETVYDDAEMLVAISSL